MIIDSHHHMVPTKLNDKMLSIRAKDYYQYYGRGARSLGVNISQRDIKNRMLMCAPDPNGEKLLERMEQCGIDITCMCIVDNVNQGSSDSEILSQNKNCARIAARSNGKIIALAGIDPRRYNAPELYRRCIEEYGMRGLKWHPDDGYYPNSSEAYRVLSVAQKLGTPLLTHTGPLPQRPYEPKKRVFKYTSPLLLDEVAQDFPDLKIIAAHMGRYAWHEWASLAQFRKNLYGDLAMWQVFAVTNYNLFCSNLRQIIDIAGADSVLFGSDGIGFSSLVPNEEFIKILLDLPKKSPPGIKFTDKEITGILGNNAAKIFGLNA
jgi:predicted TIM-barrel fold metal-dependent hydrolase